MEEQSLIMLVDTHAHLDFDQFHRQHDKIISRAHKAGVKNIINIGTSLQGSRDSIILANKYSEVYASVGIHPHDALTADRAAMANLLELAQNQKVVAIGEIGLDYAQNKVDKAIQKKAFIVQIGLAKRLSLPIIVHNREADNDILSILKIQDHNLAGVIHCFSSDWTVAKSFLDLGYYISFTGSITFGRKKQIDQTRGCSVTGSILEVVKKAPLDKILLETDCPFLSPEPYRGQTNEPAYVEEVAKKIAQVKGLSFKKIAEVTTQNAINLFKLKN